MSPWKRISFPVVSLWLDGLEGRVLLKKNAERNISHRHQTPGTPGPAPCWTLENPAGCWGGSSGEEGFFSGTFSVKHELVRTPSHPGLTPVPTRTLWCCLRGRVVLLSSFHFVGSVRATKAAGESAACAASACYVRLPAVLFNNQTFWLVLILPFEQTVLDWWSLHAWQSEGFIGPEKLLLCVFA